MEEAAKKADEIISQARAEARRIVESARLEAEREADLTRKKGLLEIEAKVRELLSRGEAQLAALKEKIAQMEEKGPEELVKEVLGK